MSKFLPKFNEPSTWAGFGLLIAGLGKVFQVSEAPAVADAVTSIAQNPTWQGGAMALFGALAVILREKGTRN